MNTEQLFTQSWEDFVSKINKFMEELSIDQDTFECDHAAIRVNSRKKADELRVFFKKNGKVISENIINGRPILIIELNKPLILNRTSVPYVELPYPGNSTYPYEGWEHVEFIIPGKTNSIDTLKQSVITLIPNFENVFHNENEQVKIKFSSPKGDNERLPNPTIALKKNSVCIKLHSHSIKDIIDSEQA